MGESIPMATVHREDNLVKGQIGRGKLTPRICEK